MPLPRCTALAPPPAGVIAVSKEGIKFSVKGDLGTGNITRKNHVADKDEESTKVRRGGGSGARAAGPHVSARRLPSQVVMEAPVELTFALRYLNYFTKATPLATTVGQQDRSVMSVPRAITSELAPPPAGLHPPVNGRPAHGRVQD